MSVLSDLWGALFSTPEYLGRSGEKSAAQKLKWVNFCGYRGTILRNVYVPKKNGETTEIDLLYLTQKGIFVLESKNYAGYIFGRERNQNWTSTLYAGRDWLGRKKVEKHHFYNPIWQNQSHIRYLLQWIGVEVPMFSIIVFSSRGELKEMEVTSPDVVVCQQKMLPYWIRRIWDCSADALTEAEIEELYQLLLPLTMVDEATRKKHIQEVNAYRNHR